ncbi:MAG: hypothetical protein M0P26_05635, partial [Bacteroidales bacterium]|nr:hypothetical protein [Bacteroidales bacterium]
MDNNIANLIASMKGLAGSGGVLGQAVKGMVDYLMTMEPGDIVRANPPTAIAAPIASDLWYLWYHANFLAKYYEGVSGFDGRHFDYNPYLVAQLGFLSILPGLKPLKVVCDLKQLTTDISTSVFGKLYHAEYANNGVYWINTMAFELCPVGISEQYPSGKPSGDYVGYVTFPIGQLDAMEVVSLLQETDLSGYAFAAVENLATYHVKIPKNNGTLLNEEKPSLQTEYQIFPDAKNSNGNVLSGQNYCYGRHLIESAYIVPSVPKDSQNKLNSRGTTAYAPIPKLDVELFSKDTGKYP